MLLHEGFQMYNNLPNEIKAEQRLQILKRKLAQYIKNKERRVYV